MPDYKLVAETGRLTITGHPVNFTVTRASQLPEALKSKKPIIIDNPEMEKRFRSLQGWQEARIWVMGLLIATLLAYAISRDYKIEFSWQRNWRINTIDGKVTLTPIERK